MKPNYHLTRIHVFLVLFVSFFSLPLHHIFAEYPRAAKGTTVVIGEFVYDDDYTPTTTPCTISIYNPSNASQVSGANMTVETTGWQHYDYAISLSAPEGNWPTYMSCGYAGSDLVKVEDRKSVV